MVSAYAAATVAALRPAVVVMLTGAATLNVNLRVSRSVSDVARTVNVYAPAAVGVPASVPVVDSSATPPGSAPLATLQLTVPTPPSAASVRA